MIVGLLTYDHHHLKTEQVVLNLLDDRRIDEIRLHALPFNPRPSRQVLFTHRPDQTQATHTRHLEALEGVSWHHWDGQTDIGDGPEDYFVIVGAGIVNPSRFGDTRVVNCHPGIIPIQRGLDALKWAIHDGNDIGNTLHFVDEEVDGGEVIASVRTPVFPDDTIETVARRHYEMEIRMLSCFLDFIVHGGWQCCDAPAPARKRMPADTEAVMLDRFKAWKSARAATR